MLSIKTFYFNPYRECTYVITLDNQPNICLIVDPGMYGEKEEKRLFNYLKDQQITPAAILITHTHLDHICGAQVLQKAYPTIPIYGYNFLHQNEHTPITVAEMSWKMLFTPGHKEDSVCYYFETEKVLFSGDTLFQESIGRTDLPGGDMVTLMQSLAKLKSLPNEVMVYPGHGYATTIQHEKECNPYL